MKLTTAITDGIKVSVKTEFRHDLSRVQDSLFFFNYRIEIENRNDFSVQLKSRCWYIFDSLNELRSVNGEGVVGEQPILEPGEVYTYTSGCDLNSEIGNMHGYYMFTKVGYDQTFPVTVPKFDLIYHGRNN